MTLIIMPPPTPQRREIIKDGIRYREILPGDDLQWWEALLGILFVLFVIFPIFMVLFVYVLIPFLDYLTGY